MTSKMFQFLYNPTVNYILNPGNQRQDVTTNLKVNTNFGVTRTENDRKTIPPVRGLLKMRHYRANNKIYTYIFIIIYIHK